MLLRIKTHWHRWQQRMHKALHGSWAHKIFGARIFHQAIWSIDKSSLARGAAMGLFISFTPTIPFQMLLCTIGAMLLKVNLPIALAGCFTTNPVTALPFYIFARHLGQQLLTETWLKKFTLDLFAFESRTGRFMEQTIYLWTGCLLVGAIAAVLGYVGVKIFWSILWKMKQKVDARLHK